MDTLNRVPEDFWNSKAKTFPRYSEGEDTYEGRMLNIARSHGVNFKGASILDVGCGSGMYTIRLAKEAGSVTATDLSSEMLRILAEDASVNGVDNINIVRCDWLEFKSDEKFDVVFCSMTPAVQSEKGRGMLLEYASGFVVYMGFSGQMRSNMMTGLYQHYGITPKQFNDAPLMREWLTAKGFDYKSYPVDGQWVVPRAYEEAAANCSDMLSVYGVAAEAEVLEEHIKRFADGSGKYTELTDYSIEMIIWHV